MNVEFTDGRVSDPATDQMWFIRVPTVHPWCCFSTTNVGPRPNFFEPSKSSVAVGISRAGPRRQMKGCDLLGEKKRLCTVSPRPACEKLPTMSLWYMTGTMVLEITFQCGFRAMGITGWKFMV